MSNEIAIKHELLTVEAHLERVEAYVLRIRGERDKLIERLTDLQGAHDQRFAGPRN